jgi:hypothetical protein
VAQYLVAHPSVIPPTVNFIVIGVLLLWLGKRPFISIEYSSASLACMRFYWSWTGVWVTWFFFYGYLLVEELSFVNWGTLLSPWLWSAVQNSLNNIQTGFVILCYFLLAWPIAASVDKIEFQPSTVIIPLFAGVVALASFECLTAGFTPHFYPEHTYYFEVFSAFAGGVAIALFASRLGSLFTGRVTLSISLLLIYALLQIGYSAFRLHPILKEIVLMLAIPLKIWMFIFVRWLMTGGRLLFYFQESIFLHSRINDDWMKFSKNMIDEMKTSSTKEN